MRLLMALVFNLVFSIVSSMFLGLYLPLDPVNRMFIAGLAVPAIFSAVFVLITMTERLKFAGATLSLITPLLALGVYHGIVG